MNHVTERSAIFSGDEVRATLEGRKTMFRRVVKPQPILDDRLCDCVRHIAGLLEQQNLEIAELKHRVKKQDRLIDLLRNGQPGLPPVLPSASVSNDRGGER